MGNDTNNLHPDHLKDLKKSGLSNQTIQEAGFYSVPPCDISKKLGFNSPKIESLLAFPYPGCDGFVRYKPFPSLEGRPKYLQKKDTGSHLYIPERVRAAISDSSVPLYITEGEKKTLKAVQEGLICIGLGGLWNWSDGSEEKNLNSTFNLIVWQARTVFITPDNDWLSPDRHGEKKNLKQGVYELAYRLIDRGARVYLVELPSGPLKGLDDYLLHHSIDEFKVLPQTEVRKLTVDEMVHEASIENYRDILKSIAPKPEVEKEIYINRMAEKLGISKGAIRGDLKKIQGHAKEKDEDIEKLLESDSAKQFRFSAQEVIDGRLIYGGTFGGRKVLLRSDGEIVFQEEGEVFRYTRSHLTPSAAKRYRAGETANGKDLIDRLTGLFSTHIIFRDRRVPLLLAVWTMGTYLFKVFRFYGYILINSPVKRCGKSLLLDLLSHTCFNATPRLVNPSEAYVFREVDGNDATLIIDEVESLGDDDKEKKANLISLLNAGFQKGSKAPRMEVKGKVFEPVYFSAYSPKVFAGISDIVDTIEDRSFRVTMARKLKAETVDRFNLRKREHELEVLREDLFLWALKNAEDVAQVYEASDGFKGIESIDDRQKDILEPLLSIASVIDAESGKESLETYAQLVDLALDMSGDRAEREQLDCAVPAIVGILKDFLDGDAEKFVPSEDLFKRVQEEETLGFISSKKALSKFLSNFGVHPSPTPRRQSGKPKRGYLIHQKCVEETEARYA